MTSHNPTAAEAALFLTTITKPADEKAKSVEVLIREDVVALLASGSYEGKGLTVSTFMSVKPSATNASIGIQGNIGSLTEAEATKLGVEVQDIVVRITGRTSMSCAVTKYTPPVTTADTSREATAPAKFNISIAFGRGTVGTSPIERS